MFSRKNLSKSHASKYKGHPSILCSGNGDISSSSALFPVLDLTLALRGNSEANMVK